MKAYNKGIADAFNEIADLLGILGEGFFTIRAYQEAARILTEEAYPITKKEADVQKLQELDKIGAALAAKIVEYIETGKIKHLEELREKVPQGVRELLAIPGLGPGRVGKLYLTAGVTSKMELIRQAESGALEQIPGFGRKMVEKILAALDSDQQKKKRHDRKEIEQIAKKFLPILRALKGAKSVEVAGSFRRKSKTVGDMDILVTGKVNPKSAEEEVRKTFPQIALLGSGDTKISFVIFPNNLQVDIRFVPEESYGAALLYFTGSKDFNVKMRKKALQMGYLLNEYALFEKGEYLVGETERDIFKALQMTYVPPEKRI